MKQGKSGSEGAVLHRRQQRRASIQWFAVALIIALTLFGTFVYLLAQEQGDPGSGGGGHSGQADTSAIFG